MKFHHTAISVNDLDKSVSFYEEVLGFTEETRFEKESPKLRACFLKRDDVRLELFELANRTRNKDNYSDLAVRGIKHLCFEVEDIEQAHREFAQKTDVDPLTDGTNGARYFFFKDPDGFPIELYQYKDEPRKGKRIEKKVWPAYFEKILSGEKTYELRLADFDCGPGDVLVLREWDPTTKEYTGRTVEKDVTYVGKTKNITFWTKEEIENHGFQIISFK